MIDYFYYTLIEMQYNDDFTAYFIDDVDYAFINRAYTKYIAILDYYQNDYPIIDSIVKYIMDVYEKDNIEICLIEMEYIPVITVPRKHLYYIISNILLNPSQTIGFPFKVIKDDINISISDNILTKPLYMLMLKVLQARIINHAVKEAINDIYADDQQTDSLKDAIAMFIHTKVFNEDDLKFEQMINHTYIPQLYGLHDSYILHIFDESHPIIVNGKIHADINLSGCFIDKSVSELHSELLSAFNKLYSNENNIVLTVKDEDDCSYIKVVTNNTTNVSIDIIYHKVEDFKDACIEHFVNKFPNKFIKDIIELHDNEYGLIDDVYDFPPHPPESFEEIPEPITPFLINIAKTL